MGLSEGLLWNVMEKEKLQGVGPEHLLRKGRPWEKQMSKGKSRVWLEKRSR